MSQELSIAFAAGIPFSLDGSEMKPLNGVSEAELVKGAPAELIEILKQYDH
jgi:argininosuccinate synthase